MRQGLAITPLTYLQEHYHNNYTAALIRRGWPSCIRKARVALPRFARSLAPPLGFSSAACGGRGRPFVARAVRYAGPRGWLRVLLS